MLSELENSLKSMRYHAVRIWVTKASLSQGHSSFSGSKRDTRTSFTWGDGRECYQGASRTRVPGVDTPSQQSIRDRDRGETDSVLSIVVDHGYCVSGSPGVGKSHLAQALGNAAIKQGHDVLYVSIFDLVRELQEDDDLESGPQGSLKRYLKPTLLIIDDMGIKTLPPRSGERLFEIIMRRYEKRSTIMTSNRPIEEWGKLLGDVPSATAILDRFLHHAEIIAIEGQSYRLADRQKAQSKQAKQ